MLAGAAVHCYYREVLLNELYDLFYPLLRAASSLIQR